MMITPDYISSLVNFYSNSLNPDWRFSADGTDMRNLQVKGAAKVFNILEKEKLRFVKINLRKHLTFILKNLKTLHLFML